MTSGPSSADTRGFTAVPVDGEKAPLLANATADQGVELESASSTAEHFRHPHLLGLTLITLATFTLSIVSVCVKIVSKELSSMEMVFWRSLIAWVLNFITMQIKGVDMHVRKDQIPTLAIRAIGGVFAMSLSFYGMQQMVLADATVLIYLSPLATFIVGAMVLGERIDAIGLSCAIFSFVGVIFVVRPAFLFDKDQLPSGSEASTFAIGCCIASAFLQAVVYVAMRKLQDLEMMTIVHYFLLTGVLISGASLLFIQRSFILDMSLTTWVAVIIAGITGFVGQLLLTRGFQIENVGIGSVMRYLGVVFVFLWDSLFLQEHINPWSILGAVIVCGGAIAVTLRKMHISS